jgi:glycosyltransferase involved in cell wall biosynthesis
MGVALVLKVLILLNSAWNLLNFRSGLIRALIADGHNVVLAAPTDLHVPALQALGARFVDIPMDAHGTNPFSEMILLFRLTYLMMRERPNALLTFTAKPNIYGSLVAGLFRVPVVNNIAGLGSVFIKGGWMIELLKGLFRLSLARSKRVFFQNTDDLMYFLSQDLIREDQVSLLPGSGVDLQLFQRVSLPTQLKPFESKNLADRPFVFLLVARMLADKGVEEYVQAACKVKILHPNCVFALLGPLDLSNPAAISEERIHHWKEEGTVEYWGTSNDVRTEIANADCVVLPSYREGTPRSLLEAAAMGRPLLATDVPGCREVVIHGVNGLLCKPRDAQDLADQMSELLKMPSDSLVEFGNNSRLLVEKKFDEQFVIQKYLEVAKAL